MTQNRDSAAYEWVLTNMTRDCQDALMRFAALNPHYRGAQWDDCLDVLLDTDALCDVTEPLYEASQETPYSARLMIVVGLTCYFASQVFAEATPEQQLAMVLTTIRNNS